jgi:small subunit ribosomal protein S16
LSVKIRLRRAGSKGRPFYRVVIIDSRMQRDGRFIEELGYYDPLEKPQVINVDRVKVDQWMAKGAEPSETVRTLLKRPNSTIQPREKNREFSPGPVRVRAPRPEGAHDTSGDRGGRGGRGGGGGRGGAGGGGRGGAGGGAGGGRGGR